MKVWVVSDTEYGYYEDHTVYLRGVFANELAARNLAKKYVCVVTEVELGTIYEITEWKTL